MSFSTVRRHLVETFIPFTDGSTLASAAGQSEPAVGRSGDLGWVKPGLLVAAGAICGYVGVEMWKDTHLTRLSYNYVASLFNTNQGAEIFPIKKLFFGPDLMTAVRKKIIDVGSLSRLDQVEIMQLERRADVALYRNSAFFAGALVFAALAVYGTVSLLRKSPPENGV